MRFDATSRRRAAHACDHVGDVAGARRRRAGKSRRKYFGKIVDIVKTRD